LIAIEQNDLDLHSILKATVDALLDQSRQELVCYHEIAHQRSFAFKYVEIELTSIHLLGGHRRLQGEHGKKHYNTHYRAGEGEH
jgi:hypothetical protein